MEDLVIKCGKNSDHLEKLKALCKAEAEKLLLSIEVNNTTVSVPCWTDDFFPELIGVVHFKKDATGQVRYDFDDSASTL